MVFAACNSVPLLPSRKDSGDMALELLKARDPPEAHTKGRLQIKGKKSLCFVNVLRTLDANQSTKKSSWILDFRGFILLFTVYHAMRNPMPYEIFILPCPWSLHFKNPECRPLPLVDLICAKLRALL